MLPASSLCGRHSCARITSSCSTDQRLALQGLSCPGLSDPSLRQPSKGFQQGSLDAALKTAQPAPSSSLKSPRASLAGALEAAEPVALRTPPSSAQKVGWLRSAMPVCLSVALVG